MDTMIDAFISRTRTVLTVLFVIVAAGVVSYINIPKEADPDIPIPFVLVTIPHPGISPEDSERLLVKPMETRLRTIEGIEHIRAFGSQNFGSIVLEFDVNFDKDQALIDVREQVDIAKSDLPDDSEEPLVEEINASLFPTIVVTISGDAAPRALYELARRAKDDIEAIPNVLEATIRGQPEELLEVLVDPSKLESYNISQVELINAVTSNNRLVAAGSLDTGQGRFQVKVPGLFETAADVLGLPLKVEGDAVVTLSDIADIRRTFKDAKNYARYDGEKTIAIEVVKRLGSNIVETNTQVRAAMKRAQEDWDIPLSVNYSFDQSNFIDTILISLQASITTAIVLVMIIVVAALGIRSGLLVGLAIPSSFLIGFFFLGSFGYTINMIVMFGMLLSVGVLVDGAIVMVEYGDRKMAEGLPKKDAYSLAAKRMFWPITSSIATTLAAFLPLLLWPGMTGRFMSFLPITTIFVLTSSLLMALVFLPVVGALVGKAQEGNERTMKALAASETGNVRALPGFTGYYARTVAWTVEYPLPVIAGAILVSMAGIILFMVANHGVQYGVNTEPEEAAILVGARGNLSSEEMRDIVFDVEQRVKDIKELKTVFTNTGQQKSAAAAGGDGDVPEDTIGKISVEIIDHKFRDRTGWEILEDIRARTSDIPGVRVEIRKRGVGVEEGKSVQIEVSGNDPADLLRATTQIREKLDKTPQLIDVEDSRPLPGIEWQINVDREQAGRFGADVTQVGAAVQLITNGVKIGEYRPDDAEDEVEIRARFKEGYRNLDQLDRLKITTTQGLVPIANFVNRRPMPQVQRIERLDGTRIYSLKANAAPGILTNDVVEPLKAWAETADFPSSVKVKFVGSSEEQEQAGAFFMGVAFPMSMFLMAIILLTQFNSFYHSMLILSSVVFSTIGVLVGTVVTLQPISVIMSGTGIIALAGIVVNNNIVLIDTYQRLLADGFEKRDAIVRTAAQRLRPIFLTTVTTVCGLLPMVFQISVDFFRRDVTFGGQSAIWFQPLATAIVSGLIFSTMLTLVLTPALLSLPIKLREWMGMDEDAETKPADEESRRPLRAAE
jgi:multidrug efflux pump